LIFAAARSVLLAHRDELFAHHLRQPLGPRENVGEVDPPSSSWYPATIFLLEPGEAVQAHVENGLA
jgi:hypothetical protein